MQSDFKGACNDFSPKSHLPQCLRQIITRSVSVEMDRHGVLPGLHLVAEITVINLYHYLLNHQHKSKVDMKEANRIISVIPQRK